MFTDKFGAATSSRGSTPPGNITIVVAFPAGGPLVIVAHLSAEKFGAKFGRTVVVESKPGAAGNIGGAAVVRAAPDGMTWLLTFDSMWTVPRHLGAKPNFDVDNDLVPVGRIGQVALALAVNEMVPAQYGTQDGPPACHSLSHTISNRHLHICPSFTRGKLYRPIGMAPT